MKYPVMYRAEQEFVTQGITDIPTAVRECFENFKPKRDIRPGQSVAVGVASRGTYDLKDLVKTSVQCLKEIGLKPFIIPAMGSHGGATGPGQIQVLRDLGITEDLVGVPIRASMDVVSFGRIENGSEVFFAQDALTADHIMVINRVKPHTGFRGEVESGLCKILAVGLGRQKGARNVHRYELADTVVPSALRIMENAHLLCGLAVTENALGQTHSLKVVNPSEFVDTDREFLKVAWQIMPRIPFEYLDLLIIDRMGKDISGTGMDPNVIGFWRRNGGGACKPYYKTLAVMDLTDASHGNALGLGMADLIPERLKAKVNFHNTYMNCITAGAYSLARMPVVLENDRKVIDVALEGLPDIETAKVVRISSTSKLKTFWISKGVLAGINENIIINVDQQPLEFCFDAQDRLLPF